MNGIEEWWADGEYVSLTLSGVPRRIFLRRIAGSQDGETITFLHGFPSSSHDYWKVLARVDGSGVLLLPDFLGFGASDKPRDHVYSIGEQANLVLELWRAEAVSRTRIVAHDYAVSVAQELLARRAEGALDGVEITRVDLTNGGLYPELHRPQPVQTALLDPEQGPKVGPLMTEDGIVAGLAPTFAPGYDGRADSVQIWRSIERDHGNLIAHRLIRYITDRAENRDRWVAALERTDVPLSFVWGMLDPISGAHMAQRIRERLPGAPFAALDDVGHWPPLEAPDRVVAAISAPLP